MSCGQLRSDVSARSSCPFHSCGSQESHRRVAFPGGSGGDGHHRKRSPHLLGFLNNTNLINPDRSPNKEKFVQVVTSLNLKSVQQLECPLPDCAIYGAPCPLHSHLSVANPVFFPAAPGHFPVGGVALPAHSTWEVPAQALLASWAAGARDCF